MSENACRACPPQGLGYAHSLSPHGGAGNTGHRSGGLWDLERQVPFARPPSPLTSKAYRWRLQLAEGGEGNCFVEPALKGEVRPWRWKLGQSGRVRAEAAQLLGSTLVT